MKNKKYKDYGKIRLGHTFIKLGQKYIQNDRTLIKTVLQFIQVKWLRNTIDMTLMLWKYMKFASVYVHLHFYQLMLAPKSTTLCARGREQKTASKREEILKKNIEQRGRLKIDWEERGGIEEKGKHRAIQPGWPGEKSSSGVRKRWKGGLSEIRWKVVTPQTNGVVHCPLEICVHICFV